MAIVFVVIVALGGYVLLRTDEPLLASAVITLAVVLSIVHFRYDLMLLVVPVAVGVGQVLDGVALGPAGWFVLATCVFVFFHVDGATAVVFKKTELRNGGVDVTAMMAAFGVTVASVARRSRRRRLEAKEHT